MKIPTRRTGVDLVSDYKEYKDLLKEDFHNKCGYCDSSYTWRTTWFEIDHFVPQKFLKVISKTEYSNLVFACRSCNNSKRAKWPTGSETVHNNGIDEGFIDPCSPDYDQQFARHKNGSIRYKTALGKWMFHQLKLHKPQHQIIWLIEQIDSNIEELKRLAPSISDKTLEAKMKEVLLSLHMEYHFYTKKLAEQ